MLYGIEEGGAICEGSESHYGQTSACILVRILYTSGTLYVLGNARKTGGAFVFRHLSAELCLKPRRILCVLRIAECYLSSLDAPDLKSDLVGGEGNA